MKNLSTHAYRRAVQRGLPIDAIDYILDHGQVFHRAGAMFYYLRKRDIPQIDLKYELISRLEGTAVVVAKDKQTIITVWRNRDNGLKNIRNKSRYTSTLERYLK